MKTFFAAMLIVMSTGSAFAASTETSPEDQSSGARIMCDEQRQAEESLSTPKIINTDVSARPVG